MIPHLADGAMPHEDTGRKAKLGFAMGHGARSHGLTMGCQLWGACRGMLDTRPHGCSPWDTGHITVLVLFASWPLEAAAVFAVAGSCLQALLTLRSSAQAAQCRHEVRWKPPGSPPAAHS